MMDQEKKRRLEAAGWSVGQAHDFLEMTSEERTYLDLKLALAGQLKECRVRLHMSQADLAKHLHSSQSRVAKMEAGDPGVSMDLLLRALLATGATRRTIAKAIASPTSGR